MTFKQADIYHYVLYEMMKAISSFNISIEFLVKKSIL